MKPDDFQAYTNRGNTYFRKGLLWGDRAEAAKRFRAALATGVTHFVEYRAAEAELRRLGQ